METINYQGLSFQDAKKLCETLAREFGLYWTWGGFCVTGNTVTGTIKKNYRKSKDYINARYDVEIYSSYFTEHRIIDTMDDFEYYRVASLEEEDHEHTLN